MAHYYTFLLLIVALAVGLILFLGIQNIHKGKPSFETFLAEARTEAIQQGISKPTVGKYLTNIKPIQRTIKHRKTQPQMVDTFDQYIANFIPQARIQKAHEELQKHRTLLTAIGKKYQVEPRYIIALWGIESHFGKLTGKFPIIQSLATLAHGKHRAEFYRAELFAALKILDQRHTIPEQQWSAWDGGMGQIQFEPTRYLKSAVDYDGDGFKNIWTSLPDIFASIAHLLRQNDWHDQQPWGMRVTIPKDLPLSLVGPKTKKTIAEWQTLGVRQLDGSALKPVDSKASIVLPDRRKGPAFLVYHNFEVLLDWNKSHFEALATGILANHLK